MKLFKKLLAVTLVAVLALTVFTACGDSGSTSEIPSDLTEQKYYQNLNDAAFQYNASAPLYYSESLSAYTRSKLNLYIQYDQDEIKEQEYKDGKNKLEDECKAKLGYVVAEQDEVQCALITTSTPKYEELYKMENAYNAATKVAIARVYSDPVKGGNGKTYTMIECYKTVK